MYSSFLTDVGQHRMKRFNSMLLQQQSGASAMIQIRNVNRALELVCMRVGIKAA